ncbi:efflux RND transporter periplasmic adaptor subunit [Kushneria phosphatilytica]|uniref:Efflux RND transporter periplasmic adaptor subunit n=1 Tax=Kushneria phosphatilytica TaxID=657387 RepID=A0A1S1NRY2_9GAMM|nr:efflux RND transporter periplasmic adaptor subunit [Kushneria phosphatilytica]OHV11999.1 efflux transporter periplasmic adaptor subunit [Kushneria phosphatilytica]QEL11186.1 efflux RND transporter periplasmic adaptor subunit [Kushneria phosphatilytica]
MIRMFASRAPQWGLIGVMALLLAACGGSDEDQQQSQKGGGEQPPRKVAVMTVQSRDLELDMEYPAMIRSDLSADIVARVAGVLEKKHYQPGEMVQKGQKLFTIEQPPYQATVDQREADLQSARADLEEAQRNWARYKRLYSRGAISQQQRDTALNTLQTAQASVAQAKAALESARIDLDYTTVKSPVSGMVSLNEVNVGNYVTQNTELATVTPLDPLEVRFSLPQEDAFALRRQRQMQDAPEVTATLKFPYANQQDTTANTLKGKIDFLGSRVDESTSTVQARAIFKNPDHLFLPGQFVRIELQNLKRFHVLAVPNVAVTEGLKGPQLYVLNDDNVIQSRFVSLGEQAGSRTIITEGLKAGERIVAGSIGSVSVGQKVDPQPYQGSSEQPTNPSGHPLRHEREPKQGTGNTGVTEQRESDQSQQAKQGGSSANSSTGESGGE